MAPAVSSVSVTRGRVLAMGFFLMVGMLIRIVIAPVDELKFRINHTDSGPYEYACLAQFALIIAVDDIAQYGARDLVLVILLVRSRRITDPQLGSEVARQDLDGPCRTMMTFINDDHIEEVKPIDHERFLDLAP